MNNGHFNNIVLFHLLELRPQCVQIIETIHVYRHVHRHAKKKKNEPNGPITISTILFRRRAASNQMDLVGWNEVLLTAEMNPLGN